MGTMAIIDFQIDPSHEDDTIRFTEHFHKCMGSNETSTSARFGLEVVHIWSDCGRGDYQSQNISILLKAILLVLSPVLVLTAPGWCGGAHRTLVIVFSYCALGNAEKTDQGHQRAILVLHLKKATVVRSWSHTVMLNPHQKEDIGELEESTLVENQHSHCWGQLCPQQSHGHCASISSCWPPSGHTLMFINSLFHCPRQCLYFLGKCFVKINISICCWVFLKLQLKS